MEWHQRREPRPLRQKWPHPRCPRGGTQGVGWWMQTLFLNPDPFQHWYGVKNVARVKINGKSCMALLNNGMQMNTIMPSYVKSCSLEVGPITNLIGRWVTCIGLGNAYTWPLGYVVIQVQVDEVQSFNEDQIALVVPDLLNFAARIPVILGTPTISHIINVIKEREIDALVTPWANAHVPHLLSVWRDAATVEDIQAMGESSLSEYNEVVATKNTETVDAFSSHVIPVKAEKAYMEEGMNIMTHALWVKDGSLPQDLTVQNVYNELREGSKNVVVVVRNSMAYPQTLKKKTLVARAVATTVVPELLAEARLLEGVDKPQDSHTPKLTVRQRQGTLFEELDLSGLESWPPELADSTQWLLAKYHNVFSLEPTELGCTHSTKHIIKVTNDTPFKEQFRWIPLPLVEEVHSHLWEMPDLGAIWPSQSVWCNAVVLVIKKDGGLCFCIDFHHLNAHTKKDSYPLPRILEPFGSLVGAGHFSCLDLKLGFWQIKMEEASKQYTTFTVGNLGFFECNHMPFWLCNASTMFQQLMQNCLGKLNLIYCLIYLDDIIVVSWRWKNISTSCM